MRLSSYRRTLPTALLLALTTASGCGMAAVAFRNPTVELKGVQMRGIGLMDVLLDVYNPNYSDFEVRNVTYTVFADSIQVAMGEVTELEAAGEEDDHGEAAADLWRPRAEQGVGRAGPAGERGIHGGGGVQHGHVARLVPADVQDFGALRLARTLTFRRCPMTKEVLPVPRNSLSCNSAEAGNRTQMTLRSRDFKSLASSQFRHPGGP